MPYKKKSFLKKLLYWGIANYDEPKQCVEKQRCYSANKDLYSQGYDLPKWSCMVVRTGL